MPAGIVTLIMRACEVRPRPRQLGQGSVIVTPSPRQAVHGALVMNWPRIVCCTRRTSPVPPQVAQRGGVWPSFIRVPWQDGAGFQAKDFDVLLGAENRFLEGKRYGCGQVLTARRSRSAARPLPPPKKLSKRSPNGDPPNPPNGSPPMPFGSMTETVIRCPSVGVRKDLVRLIDLLETLLGRARRPG